MLEEVRQRPAIGELVRHGVGQWRLAEGLLEELVDEDPRLPRGERCVECHASEHRLCGEPSLLGPEQGDPIRRRP